MHAQLIDAEQFRPERRFFSIGSQRIPFIVPGSPQGLAGSCHSLKGIRHAFPPSKLPPPGNVRLYFFTSS
jgi:hypothetical protein